MHFFTLRQGSTGKNILIGLFVKRKLKGQKKLNINQKLTKRPLL